MHKIFLFFVFIFLPFFGGISSSFAKNASDIVNYGASTMQQVEDEIKGVPLPKIERDDLDTTEKKINHILITVIYMVLSISGFVAVVMIVVGGVRYTISTGDDNMIDGAKKMILFALLGLTVVIFSYAIFTNIVDFLEVGEDITN